MIKVDYKNSITNLSNSILKHFGVTPFHETIKEVDNALKGKKRVIVFLFDAMGHAILEKHLPKDSYFRSNVIKTIRSTLPPTTVAATNSFLSAKYPIENGWFGWVQYFKDLDKNIKVFKNQDKDTGEYLPDKELVMDKVAGYKDITTLINEKSGKKIAKQYKGYPVDKTKNVRFLSTLVRTAFDHAVSKEETFTYAYWTNPDALLHENGTTSPIVTRIIKRIQKLVRSYANKHKDVAVIVIADHGQIDISYKSLSNYPDFVDTLVRLPSFEGRCLNFYVKKNKEKEFEELFNKYFGKEFELFTKKEVLEKELFGLGEGTKMALSFLGDYIAVATSTISINRSEDDDPLKGHHAGGTEDEFLIDVIGLNI